MRFVDYMQKKYITTANTPFAIHKNLNFVMFLRTAIHHRFLLILTEKNPNSKTLVKIRISSHKRNIETFRHDKISRCDRVCPVCGLNIEDEIHFLFNCLKYSTIFLVKRIIESLITSTYQFQL